jgi:hypothetical protein
MSSVLEQFDGSHPRVQKSVGSVKVVSQHENDNDDGIQNGIETIMPVPPGYYYGSEQEPELSASISMPGEVREMNLDNEVGEGLFSNQV